MNAGTEKEREVPTSVDVVVVGAGLAGLYAHYRFRPLGFSVVGFEAASGVGGTWYWNGYPGARCDVESLDYSYSFSPELLDEWRWSERYATQPEILRYVNHVADRFELRRDIAFDTRVVGARWDDAENLWTVETDRGDKVRCRFLVSAAGCLSFPKPPEYPGLEDFKGKWVLTSAWPKEPVELAGMRIAVIGAGSSGMQSIPIIAQQAAHLTVFQRTPNYSVPARNGPVNPAHEERVRADYPKYCRELRQTPGGQRAPLATGLSALEVSDELRQAKFEESWQFGGLTFAGVFNDLILNPAANELAAEFVRSKIRQTVKDPAVAERLTPRNYPFATKRPVVDTDYFGTYNRPNVELVDVRSTPIERITADGVATSEKEYPVDLIVFATGFDAMTGALRGMNIQGVDGLTLKSAWEHGPATFLGLMVAGFPNLFTVNGPGSPSVLTNMITSIEHHVDWIADCIAYTRANRQTRIEADPEAQAAWGAEVREIADKTLFPRGNSWYLGANVPGKPRVFMVYLGGLDNYKARCAEIAESGYKAFYMSGLEPGETDGPNPSRVETVG